MDIFRLITTLALSVGSIAYELNAAFELDEKNNNNTSSVVSVHI